MQTVRTGFTDATLIASRIKPGGEASIASNPNLHYSSISYVDANGVRCEITVE